MLTRFRFVILVLLAGTSLACSGGAGPSDPGATENPLLSEYRFIDTGEATHLLGAWEVYLDPANCKVEAVPLRSVDFHVNVTKMVTPPECYDCFLAKNLVFDPDTQIMTIDIGFRNPSGITGYDVRGIVLEFGVMEFRNPDGYTELFADGPDEINPFVAYKTGIGQREFPSLHDFFETMEIYDPIFPGIDAFTYVVEASWEPDGDKNCKEPYEVEFYDVSGKLYSDGSNTQVLRLIARDWQDDVAGVIADLTEIGGGFVSFVEEPALPDVWRGEIQCAPGTIEGDYDILVRATSAPPFDQTADMYNYVTLEVTKPPVPGAEEFGLAERITTSPGQSFIWPRHAIAVTSDDVPHVVWVDNIPDPGSIEYHVYYSSRNGDEWSTPVQIDSVSGRAIYTTVVADPGDTLHVVWEDERDHVLGSEIYYASSEDAFATEMVLVPGDSGFRNVHPRIESSNDGTLHIAWHTLEMLGIDDYEYDVWYIGRQAGSPSWDSPVSVVGAEDVIEAYPSLAPAPGSGVYYAYSSDKAGTNGIYFTENTTGDFISPIAVTISGAYQPAIDVASNGEVLIAYFDNADGTFTDVYARSSNDLGQTWSPPQSISDSDDAYQIAPDIECTPDGDIHIAWHEEDVSGYPSRVLYREFVNGLGWQDIIEFAVDTQMGAFPSLDSDADNHIHAVYELFSLLEPPDENNYEIWYRSSAPD